MPIFQLGHDLAFPPPELAEPDGLLAIGGDLAPERLLLAYRMGIFPWYSPGQSILWWAPSPRLVLLPTEIHISRRLARKLKQARFQVSSDTAFAEIMAECARIREEKGEGTWIDEAMQEAYGRLHRLGHAHSVECRREGKLVGGLYGVALGRVFFGESMFSRETDASKISLIHLAAKLSEAGYLLIDCQMPTAHLQRLGTSLMPGREFYDLLARATKGAAVWPWRGEL